MASVAASLAPSGLDLLEAVKQGDPGEVKRLLDAGAPLEWRSPGGQTVLITAAFEANVELAGLLLACGADLEAKDEYGQTPLMWASKQGNAEMVQMLIDRGASIEAKNEEERTALMFAAEEGHVGAARVLLDCGAEFAIKDDRWSTPLSLAVAEGHVPAAKLLLERGANTEEIDEDWHTPLIHAAAEGNLEVTRVLLDHGAAVAARNVIGETALLQATARGHTSVVRLLLDRGAELEARSELKNTALMVATSCGKAETLTLLLERGARYEFYYNGHFESMPMGNEASQASRRLGGQAAAGAARVRAPIRAGPTVAELGKEAVKPATIVKADAAHKKDPKFSGTVEEAGRGVSMEFAEYGQKQLAIFARLHANPALLDGAEGAKHSSQIAALQEAQLALPPPEHALGKEGQLVPAEPKYGLLPSKGMNRRVPHGEIFPMRPAETGPGDQLMLNGVDADDQVSMADIFEMFAKHRLDPEYWTYTRLAEHFLTREDWVRALLQYNMAPTFVKFEGDFYGVYDVIGGPEDTEDGRAAQRLQLRAQRAKEAEVIEERQRERRRIAQIEKRDALAAMAGRTFSTPSEGQETGQDGSAGRASQAQGAGPAAGRSW
ncbi:hypothetical protein FNF27_02858 [Cafeteria roenbergensis]|uniref:Uncharacterized protein n=1 Tax=Cafeteria roenbergensis TaxID=33653 RepID=A0A5A8D859_CAFRO|nr:hypothetical protein FNF31_03970 [Cafeteria roenbergensis]KAA0175772.1 hypothetical protein FNF27_02858 [Cafeteria roenbergensis]